MGCKMMKEVCIEGEKVVWGGRFEGLYWYDVEKEGFMGDGVGMGIRLWKKG